MVIIIIIIMTKALKRYSFIVIPPTTYHRSPSTGNTGGFSKGFYICLLYHDVAICARFMLGLADNSAFCTDFGCSICEIVLS